MNCCLGICNPNKLLARPWSVSPQTTLMAYFYLRHKKLSRPCVCPHSQKNICFFENKGKYPDRSEGLPQFITSGDCKEPEEKENTIDPSPEGVIAFAVRDLQSSGQPSKGFPHMDNGHVLTDKFLTDQSLGGFCIAVLLFESR